MANKAGKITWIFVLIIVAFMAIFSHGLSWAKTQELIIGLDNDVERLVPIKIKNPQTLPVSMQIFQGLFDLNEKGEVIPRIIERYETKDCKTWIFHVRGNISFHRSEIFGKGMREVTAEDVVYSLKRFCSAGSFGSFVLTDSIKGAKEYNQGKTDHIEGLKALDKYTVQVILIRPERFFINRLSTAWICVFPKEMDKKEYEEKIGFSIAVGTGPYLLESRTENEIILKKNASYWDKNNMPQIDRLIFRVIRNDQIRLINLLGDKINLMVVPNSLFPSVFHPNGSLKENIRKKYQKKATSTYNIHFIGINNKAVSDVNLRRAMFWGTDRNEIIQAFLYGYGQALGGPVPEGMNGYQPPFPLNLFDPEKARACLKKSSYTGQPLELLVHDIANSEQIGQIFQAQMAKIGINIKLTKMDFGSVIQRILSGDNALFSMFMEWVYSSPEPILINMFSSSKIPVSNFFSFSNPAVDEMLESLYDFQDERESVTFCADIEAKVMEDAPTIFLYRQEYVVLYPKNMAGLEISGNNHYFFEKIK